MSEPTETSTVQPKRVVTRPRVVRSRHYPQSPGAITPRVRQRIFVGISILLIAAIVYYDLGGLNRLRTRPVTGVDYVPAAQYVAARHLPGEAILTALPAPVYLTVGSTEDIIFLSSPLSRKRAQRYTRLTIDGRYLDYWTGVDSVVDVPGLCNTLLTSPNLWVVVDESRLKADWAFLGPMADVITGLTYIQHSVDGGAQVRRLAPKPARDSFAEEICSAAAAGERLPTRPIPVPVT